MHTEILAVLQDHGYAVLPFWLIYKVLKSIKYDASIDFNIKIKMDKKKK